MKDDSPSHEFVDLNTIKHKHIPLHNRNENERYRFDSTGEVDLNRKKGKQGFVTHSPGHNLDL